jgi:hypothetical protein
VLSTVHDVLRAVVYRGAGFGPDEVDVRFEAPTRDFIDRLDRPTISMVPIDFTENLELGRKDFQVRRNEHHQETAFPPRRIDVRYMTVALSTEPTDEHELVWRTLAALLRTPEVPIDLLPDSIRAFNTPIVVTTAHQAEELRLLDVWSNLGVEPHPSFTCVVTLPMDPELMTRSPLVLTRIARYGRMDASIPGDERSHIGGVVRDAAGRPVPGAVVALDGANGGGSVADAQGRFVLRSVLSGKHGLRVAADGALKKVVIQAPDGPYDVTLK